MDECFMAVVPGYTIERELGRGGVGQSYLTIQDFTERYLLKNRAICLFYSICSRHDRDNDWQLEGIYSRLVKKGLFITIALTKIYKDFV